MPLHSLMFGWEYPPLHLGGLGVACQGLVQGLLRNGVKVTLVLPHANKCAEGEVTVLSTDDASASALTIPSILQPYDTLASYDTGTPLSVAPLVWSHATFVETVLLYLEKQKQLHAL